jgi:hypothetical protein
VQSNQQIPSFVGLQSNYQTYNNNLQISSVTSHLLNPSNPNNNVLKVKYDNNSDKPIGPPPGLGYDEQVFIKPSTPSILFPITNNESYENQKSLLFPLDLSYQSTHLLTMIKQLDNSDLFLLNNICEILKNYQSSNLMKLLNEIHKIKNL